MKRTYMMSEPVKVEKIKKHKEWWKELKSDPKRYDAYIEKMKANKAYYKGENHQSWKGDDVGYFGLHKWIRENKPKPQFCDDCHKRPSYEVANVSGKYKRDINDFKWLCRRCHMESDGRMKMNKKEVI